MYLGSWKYFFFLFLMLLNYIPGKLRFSNSWPPDIKHAIIKFHYINQYKISQHFWSKIFLWKPSIINRYFSTAMIRRWSNILFDFMKKYMGRLNILVVFLYLTHYISVPLKTSINNRKSRPKSVSFTGVFPMSNLAHYPIFS